MSLIDAGDPADGWDQDVVEGVGLKDWFSRVQYLSVLIQNSQRINYRITTAEDLVEELEDIQKQLNNIIPELL